MLNAAVDVSGRPSYEMLDERISCGIYNLGFLKRLCGYAFCTCFSMTVTEEYPRCRHLWLIDVVLPNISLLISFSLAVNMNM